MNRHDDFARAEQARKIRELNDRLRKTGLGGKTVLSRAVADMDPEAFTELLKRVREFDAFTRGNDPWQEHDFGEVLVNGERYFWKIDAYDLNLEFASPDATNPALTVRVLTLMTAMDL